MGDLFDLDRRGGSIVQTMRMVREIQIDAQKRVGKVFIKIQSLTIRVVCISPEIVFLFKVSRQSRRMLLVLSK